MIILFFPWRIKQSSPHWTATWTSLKHYGAGSEYSQDKIDSYKTGVELEMGRMTKQLAGLNRNKSQDNAGGDENRKRKRSNKDKKEFIISKEERLLMNAQLNKDESFPKTMGQPVLDRACKLNQTFRKIYKRIVGEKGGDKRRANNTIRKAILKKKKNEKLRADKN